MRGSQVKAMCKALDVHHRELADCLHYSRHAITKWINRDAEIPVDLVPSVCAFFKLKVTERQEQHRNVLDTLYSCMAQWGCH